MIEVRYYRRKLGITFQILRGRHKHAAHCLTGRLPSGGRRCSCNSHARWRNKERLGISRRVGKKSGCQGRSGGSVSANEGGLSSSCDDPVPKGQSVLGRKGISRQEALFRYAALGSEHLVLQFLPQSGVWMGRWSTDGCRPWDEKTRPPLSNHYQCSFRPNLHVGWA